MDYNQRLVLVEVTKALLTERLVCRSTHNGRKAICHAYNGDIGWLKKTLKKMGVDPSRIDAILPLIHG